MATKIIKFNIEPDYMFDLFAIVSSAKEFQLAWHLNKALEMDFCKMEDLKLTLSREGTKYISNLTYDSEYSTISIIRNKLISYEGETNGFLIPELKKYDYFLKIEGESVDEISEGLPKKLKSLPCVHYFEKLIVENLKSKDNLLF